ncbi:MAG: CPCC family cysteine-rich protein [Anaerovoracaceae bacterium]
MGGRGILSGANTKQLSVEEYMYREKINVIIQNSLKHLSENQNGFSEGSGAAGGGGNSPAIYKKCACCKSYIIPYGTQNKTCPICGWIDDEYQNAHSDSIDGANDRSLTDYRDSYLNSNSI